MNSKSSLTFITGLLVGVLVASTGFSLFLRAAKRSQAGADDSPTSGSASAIILKLAHTLDQKHPVHRAMQYMADRLREKSSGGVELQIFPNGQLGSETECIEQLQQGALAITKTSAGPLESFVPEIAIFGVPYVFRDEDHFWRVIQSDLGKSLLDLGQSKSMRGLCYYDAGARSFYTAKRPIQKPEDLSGLKIRVQQSKTAMDMVEALGGKPTPIPFGELYTALQSSMVDGAENNLPSFYTTRHFEVCKHLSLDEHTRVPDVLLMSTKIWSALPPAVQRWIQEAADESAEYQRKLWREENESMRQLILDQGVQIHLPDQAAFADQVKAMHQSYQGTPIGDLLKKISEL